MSLKSDNEYRRLVRSVEIRGCQSDDSKGPGLNPGRATYQSVKRSSCLNSDDLFIKK